jgi:hypothetical protein
MHNGSTSLLWEDEWNGQVLKDQYRHLASYASNLHISSRMALQNHTFLDIFDLPLSNVAYDECQELEQLLNLHLDELENDSWAYQWGATFSVSKAYATLTHSNNPMLLNGLGKLVAKKHKVFGWLLLKYRLSTKDILFRKRFFLPDYSCIMCNDNVRETRSHLFFHCKFAKECWNYICPGWNIHISSSHLECIHHLNP